MDILYIMTDNTSLNDVIHHKSLFYSGPKHNDNPQTQTFQITQSVGAQYRYLSVIGQNSRQLIQSFNDVWSGSV